MNSNSVNGYAKPDYLDTHKYVAHLYALDTNDVRDTKNFNGVKNFSL